MLTLSGSLFESKSLLKNRAFCPISNHFIFQPLIFPAEKSLALSFREGTPLYIFKVNFVGLYFFCCENFKVPNQNKGLHRILHVFSAGSLSKPSLGNWNPGSLASQAIGMIIGSPISFLAQQPVAQMG